MNIFCCLIWIELKRVHHTLGTHLSQDVCTTDDVGNNSQVKMDIRHTVELTQEAVNELLSDWYFGYTFFPEWLLIHPYINKGKQLVTSNRNLIYPCNRTKALVCHKHNKHDSNNTFIKRHHYSRTLASSCTALFSGYLHIPVYMRRPCNKYSFYADKFNIAQVVLCLAAYLIIITDEMLKYLL